MTDDAIINNAMLLVNALRAPASTAALDGRGWTALIAMARAEQLIGTLAHRLAGQEVPGAVAAILVDAKTNADVQRRGALWEADCAGRALNTYPGKIVLMKGTAYVAAGLLAGQGRHIGDLDIMVAHSDLAMVEALLQEPGGWEWVKEDAYDDAYYRDYMHELPPMIHKDRDRMIDVHHTILPLTARPRPDAAAMLADTKPLSFRGELVPLNQTPLLLTAPTPSPSPEGEGGMHIFCPADMTIHCAAHLIADGDLAGGLRNLWDFHCLTTEFADADEDFLSKLHARARHHGLWQAVHMAARLAHRLYGTAIPDSWRVRGICDFLFIRCLTARDSWGRPTRKITRLIFYIRSHLLRMPPLMLARHLFTKWRTAKGRL
jgi:Uncharacterised nucleotidyltransferase